MGYWDTDPLIVKFDGTGATQWAWSEDIDPTRLRTLPPGDYRRQECMYQITEAFDGGLVVSGNCSINHDDNYMVKMFNECNMSQSYPDAVPNIGTTNKHNLLSTQTWTTSKQISSQLVIGYGKHLIITGAGTKVRFADSRMIGKPCGIVILPGGKLTIAGGAEVTSVDNAICPGSMWDGITIVGTSTQPQTKSGIIYPDQGFLSMTSGTISNARTGVTTVDRDATGAFIWWTTGGVIQALNSDFVNNNRDVQILSYRNYNPVNNHEVPNECLFQNCRFQLNAMLSDKRKPTGRMSLHDVSGIKLRGCKFEYNAVNAYAPADRGYGILSADATYRVEDCPSCLDPRSEFKDLTYGVYAVNVVKTVPTVEINHAVFHNSYNNSGAYSAGILMTSLKGAKIDRCDFDMADIYSESVFLYECKDYDVRNNIFQGSGNNIGIVVSSSKSGNHRIFRNDFLDHYIGIKSQFENSNFTVTPSPSLAATDNGLIMNCNRFMGNNTFNIAMTGWALTGYYPAVARDQGIITQNNDKLVRNQYLASCGNEEQWHISQGLDLKDLNHHANSELYTRPLAGTGCGDARLIITANQSLNYSYDCLTGGLRPVTNSTCSCNDCCLLNDINAGLSTALNAKAAEETTFNNSIDGGETSGLLAEISTATLNSNDLKSLLSTSSPYLSDEVLIAYINSSASNNDLIEIHDLNKPVSLAVLNAIADRTMSTAEMETIAVQQAELAQSARQVLESQLNYTRSELQFMYGEKVSYYMRDTLEGAIDTVINLLAINVGELPNALSDRVDAYAQGGYHSRAFSLCDSLSALPAYEDLMGLKHLMLEIDTASMGIYKVTNDPSLLSRVEGYAADSLLTGCYQARGLLHIVYGRDFNFQRQTLRIWIHVQQFL